MTRPIQHEIDTAARRQFEQSLPAAWVARLQPDDYGIDYEVEVFQQHQPTGIAFKVQLKGTTGPSRSVDGGTAAVRLNLGAVEQLCHHINAPVVVVLADVTNRQTMWYAPQLDQHLHKRIRTAVACSQKTISLHIPTCNLLPDTTHLLLVDIAHCGTVLATRTVVQTEVPTFVHDIADTLDPAHTIRALQERADGLRIQEIETLVRSGQLTRAKEAVSVMVASPQSAVEARFAALIYTEPIAAAEHPPDAAGEEQLLGVQLDTALAMRQLARKGPRHLKYYAALAFKTAQLASATRTDSSLFLNWQVNAGQGDPYWLAALSWARRKAADLVVLRYRHAHRLLECLVQAELYSLFPHAADRVLLAMIRFQVRLWLEGLTETARAYRASLVEIVDFSLQLASVLQEWDDAVRVCTTLAWFANPEDPTDVREVAGWARDRACQLQAPDMRDEALRGIREVEEQLLNPRSQAELEHDFELEHDAYVRMAAALGVDLGDQQDPVAQIIRQGLEDLNPGRVLRNCQHLFVTIQSTGLPGRWLHLPTAGAKRLCCTLHGHWVEGISLDGLYAVFQGAHCLDCSDVAPHPEHWEWSRHWQLEQDKKHSALARGRFYI